MNPKNKVDLTNPELTIIVEVIKTVCCLSVVKDYTLYRKYNVQEVVKDDILKPDVTTAKADADTSDQTEKPDAGETDRRETKGEEDKGTSVSEKGEGDEGEGGGSESSHWRKSLRKYRLIFFVVPCFCFKWTGLSTSWTP